MTSTVPTQMKAWQYRATKGGVENNLKLETVPVPKAKPHQHLVKVSVTSLNPADYKFSEAPVVGSLAVSKPAIPGVDIAGEIVTPAQGSDLQPGTLIAGYSASFLGAAGGLAEYALINKEQSIVVPKNVKAIDAATVPVAALTAYQSLAPHIKPGDHIFWNGGSSGVGTYAIQIAKLLGAHVTVTCSGRNTELVKSLGADEVVDYTQGDVIELLSKLPYKFDLVVDGIGYNRDIYWQAHRFSKEGAPFISIAFSPTVKDISFAFKAGLLPSFLGGGKRKLTTLYSEFKHEDMQKLLGWMSEGKLKATIDSSWKMEEAVEGFKKMKTGRARGKIVVEVV